jgi:hypothetical protein
MAVRIYELPVGARMLPNGAIRFCPVWYPYMSGYGVTIKFHIGER